MHQRHCKHASVQSSRLQNEKPRNVQDDESKELKRLGALEEKSKLYDRMQRGVDLEDEAGNSRHEVLSLNLTFAQRVFSPKPGKAQSETSEA